MENSRAGLRPGTPVTLLAVTNAHMPPKVPPVSRWGRCVLQQSPVLGGTQCLEAFCVRIRRGVLRGCGVGEARRWVPFEIRRCTFILGRELAEACRLPRVFESGQVSCVRCAKLLEAGCIRIRRRHLLGPARGFGCRYGVGGATRSRVVHRARLLANRVPFVVTERREMGAWRILTARSALAI